MSQLTVSDSNHPSREIETSGRLTLDDAFEILSNRRRRYTIHHLLQRNETVDLRSLSRQVAAWEVHKPLDEVSAEERRRVYNALQQFHLPKLRDVGVVIYDSDRGKIKPTEKAAHLRAYLGRDDASDDCRTALITGGILGTGAVGLVLLGGPLPALGAILLVGTIGIVTIQREKTSSYLGSEGPPPEIARANTQPN